MATNPGPLYDFPWKPLGQYKYVVLAPLVAKVAHSHLSGTPDANADRMYYTLILTAIRLLMGHLFLIASRLPIVVPGYKVQRKGINFEQVDREENWDDYLLLGCFFSFLISTVADPLLTDSFPAFNGPGLLVLFLMHVGPVEYLYYWLHRALHHHFLYTRYHSHHHASFVTEAVSGTVHPLMEHIMYLFVFAIPPVTAILMGCFSITGFYLYFLIFDFLNLWGHCNFEFTPVHLYRAIPGLKYLLYTPSFHSLHHSQVHTNFCLFMPIYDYLGNTVDPATDSLHEESRNYKPSKVDCAFLVHGLGIFSAVHVPYVMPYLAKDPFIVNWYYYPLLPLALLLYCVTYCIGVVVPYGNFMLRGFNIELWTTPRLGFNYFLTCDQPKINLMIEAAILEAEKKNVKVVALGALNKNEALNKGGQMFVERHPDLKVRICHGNTLTAAVVVNELRPDCKEVFMTGATSKLGRAVSLYLAHKGVRVLMMTNSEQRFEKIRAELPKERRHYLVQVETAAAAKNCNTWIAGKWLTEKEQSYAPPGTHFHQFVVPPIEEYRKDCTYGLMTQIYLPRDVKNLNFCMLFLPRYSVFACFGGGILHMLEGWNHHEVGPIDITRMDTVWEAAMRQGFRPVV